MRFSIGVSKITPPHLPNIVYRSRLLRLLENNQDKQLILILGQPAQGKSTLVASYVKRSKIPSAWMNLDRDDGDPEKLFHLIVYSLQYALKEINFDDLLLSPMSARESGFENFLFRERSQSIFERITNPIYIVMDGLDQVPSNAPAFEFLHALLENAPPIIHFIIVSREIPPQSLEFQNRKMRQEALLLKNEDLAFTQEEIHDFFRETRNSPYPREQVKKIHLATQGWTGGVILLAESLSRVPEPGREKSISQDLPDHFEKEVFQYFGQEIFSSQPQPVQDFLVKSSIIDVIEPNFIRDLIGAENAEDILREHVRKNLFVQSFYQEKKAGCFNITGNSGLS